MKENLIKYLQNKATPMTVEEINGVINIIAKLEEPKEEVKEDKKK